MGTFGMEPSDANTWWDRTRGVDEATAVILGQYVEELDGRIRELDAQLKKERQQTFREKVRKAVRDGKHRLITGWVGEGSAPPISVVLTGAGQHLVQPMEVAGAFANEWGGALEAATKKGDHPPLRGGKGSACEPPCRLHGEELEPPPAPGRQHPPRGGQETDQEEGPGPGPLVRRTAPGPAR